ncbi:unnamed protein product [Calypogeia fissa]
MDEPSGDDWLAMTFSKMVKGKMHTFDTPEGCAGSTGSESSEEERRIPQVGVDPTEDEIIESSTTKPTGLAGVGSGSAPSASDLSLATLSDEGLHRLDKEPVATVEEPDLHRLEVALLDLEVKVHDHPGSSDSARGDGSMQLARNSISQMEQDERVSLDHLELVQEMAHVLLGSSTTITFNDEQSAQTRAGDGIQQRNDHGNPTNALHSAANAGDVVQAEQLAKEQPSSPRSNLISSRCL